MIVILLRLSAAAVLCFSLWNIYVVRLLWTKKDCSTTVAKQVHVKSKKNVRVRVSGKYVTLPHSSKAIYRYTVEGRDYHLKGWQHIAPEQLPEQPPVVYWKRFPKHAYLDCELMFLPELLWVFVSMLTALCLWFLAQGIAVGGIVF